MEGTVTSTLNNDRFHKFENIDEMMRNMCNKNVDAALVKADSLIGSSFIIETNILSMIVLPAD